jgi:hypothetical protein
MAVYQKIQKSFWTDSKVDDDFTPEQRYLYLYLLTNPHTNMAGCYEISTKQMSRETGLAISTVEMTLAELQNRHHVIRYDPATKEMLLVNWWKYNWGASPKVRTCVSSDIRLIKNSTFRTYLEKISNNETPTLMLTDTVSIEYPYSIDTSCSGSVSDSVSAVQRKEKTAAVYPQNRDLFLVFCREHGIKEDFGEEFFDRYSANGWTTGSGEPIRNWKNLLLSAWRKQKKQTAEEDKPKQRKRSYTLDDCVEYPPGSGQYIGKDELEAMHG